MSATALSNYQLGDLLGRGASGNVYRALNFLNGETVAIKSISLSSLPASSLPDIMSEIDLLKNLNHPNIVKYKGFARDKESLFIILEYCENGSLQTILKKFGKFPESLVAVYVRQVLQGLVYLHEQGVIHRDIKGANILTNKDGSVKLADFGVSSKAPTPDLAAVSDPDADNEVVGSPYWMAPEVIEQSGASTASDVWSVGCVIVELLEGKPPYGDLAPMQALWRIVQDESMRIPEGASPVVKDFLYQCFQKDPNLRVSAKNLLRHPWMQSAKRNLENDTVDVGTLKKGPAAREKVTSNGHKAPDVPPAAGKDGHTVKSKKPITEYSAAIQKVQEWNEALNAAPKNFGTVRRIPNPTKKQHDAPPPRQSGTAPSTAGSSPVAAAPIAAIATGGLLQKNKHVSDVLKRAKESAEAEKWDDDFAFDETSTKISSFKSDPREAAADDVNANHATVRQSKDSHRESREPSKGGNKGTARLKGIPEDYSDLAADEDNLDLELKFSNLKIRNKGRIRLMHPNDLKKMGSFELDQKDKAKSREKDATKEKDKEASKEKAAVKTETKPESKKEDAIPISQPAPQPVRPPKAASRPLPKSSSPDPPQPQRPTCSPTLSPPGSRQSSLRGKAAEAANVELQKYTEDDDDDYNDVFDGPAIPQDGTTLQSLQLTRRSNHSWKEVEEEQDPFAEFDDDFATSSLEDNLLQTKRAALHASVSDIIARLEIGGAPVREAADELLNLFETSPDDMGLEHYFVVNHGMLTILETLEGRLTRDVAVRLLRIVNYIVTYDVDNLESFCLVGGIPVIIPYTSKKHLLETRLEASRFIQHLTHSPLTLQMFISCRGLKVLVELLDEDYTVNKHLILSSLEGIGSVFDLQSPTPKPDFCRMFTREGILDPLSTALLALIKDPEVGEETTKRAVDVLLLFCQVGQADVHVRAAFAHRTIMMRLLKSLPLLPRKQLVTAIKAIKHLATSPQLIEVLQNSNAMEVLVELLGDSLKGSYSNEICSHIFQTIYSMCRLSKSRLEEASAAGLIPILKRTIDDSSPLKQFALPVLCDMANAGKVSRRLLWQNQGMQMYLTLLADPYWRVSALESILAWMQDEPARVEEVLLGAAETESIIKCFCLAHGASFARILEPLLKLLRLSQHFTAALGKPRFFKKLSEALSRDYEAVVKSNLLRMLRAVIEQRRDRVAVVREFSLDAIVGKLAEEHNPVVVRDLARQIYPIVTGTVSAVEPTRESSSRDREESRNRDSLPRRAVSSRHDRHAGLSERFGSITERLSSSAVRYEERYDPSRGLGIAEGLMQGLERAQALQAAHSAQSHASQAAQAHAATQAQLTGRTRPMSQQLAQLPPLNLAPPTQHIRRGSAGAPVGANTPLSAPMSRTGSGTSTLGPRRTSNGDVSAGMRKVSPPSATANKRRSHLMDVQWDVDENGKLAKSVKSPIRPKSQPGSPILQ